MHLKVSILFFASIVFFSCQSQNEIDKQTKLFEKEYLIALSLLETIKPELVKWKAVRVKIQDHPEFINKNPEILRNEKDLKRFSEKIESHGNELKNWKNLTNDFPTMKEENVKKMSEMRLKSMQSLIKNIKKHSGAGSRIYDNVVLKYYNED